MDLRESLRDSRWKEAQRSCGGTFSVDEDIEAFVLDLVERGYETEGSCAGHIGYGYVEFTGELDRDSIKEVRELGKAFGLEGMRFKYFGKADMTRLKFKPYLLGGGKRDWFGEDDPEGVLGLR